ncbi:hypothetical protein EYF80_022518 [Liparis tanakae]|uniref:Uncharacterized protein n=1 Tax=Liparis tanakae TaxID=230148 RepID=A0A4Z2HN23_9TELE|nr:hypothetical protein EYF80_022518 [Liparis tanakae]
MVLGSEPDRQDHRLNKESVSPTVNKQAVNPLDVHSNLVKHLDRAAVSQRANLIMAEDTRQDKRASFSAITEHNTNGMTRTSSAVASSKSGASKKLLPPYTRRHYVQLCEPVDRTSYAE